MRRRHWIALALALAIAAITLAALAWPFEKASTPKRFSRCIDRYGAIDGRPSPRLRQAAELSLSDDVRARLLYTPPGATGIRPAIETTTASGETRTRLIPGGNLRARRAFWSCAGYANPKRQPL